MSLISDNVEEMIQEHCETKQKDTALKLGISKERVGHIINQLDSENFEPGGYHEN
jgi:Mn-dependent DtxR family transcriptional regulator